MTLLPTTIRSRGQALASEDFYMDRGLCVFTAAYHAKRGHCCGCGCRHCPYDPKGRPGATELRSAGPGTPLNAPA